MNLPDSAVKQIESMVRALLPYESDYTPKTPQSRLIGDFYEAATTFTSKLDQWEGFVMHMMRQVDEHQEKQDDINKIADAACHILASHGYGDDVKV